MLGFDGLMVSKPISLVCVVFLINFQAQDVWPELKLFFRMLPNTYGPLERAFVQNSFTCVSVAVFFRR